MLIGVPAEIKNHEYRVGMTPQSVRELTKAGVVGDDGTEREADVVVLSTGFESQSFLAPMEVRGVDGRELSDVWRDGASAYLGMTVAGFPNLFVMYGPNTNLGHNSILFMIECQSRYILDCIRALQERRLASVEVKPEAMRAFDRALQEELGRTVWARTGSSWYKNQAGRITNNWSGTTTRYWWRTRRVDWDDYDLRPRGGGATAE